MANEFDVFVTGGTIGATRFGNEAVDDSVQQRRKTDPSYEPQNNGLPKLT